MPLPILVTDRLRLRERDSRDFEACVTMDSDPEVMRFIRPDSSPDDERRFNADVFAMDWPEGLGFWTITPRSDPDGFLGWIFLIPFEGDTTMADPYGDVEIGYRLKRAAWGQGYASEAARTLVDHGFAKLRLPRIGAVASPGHVRSHNVLIKAGLRRQGRRHAYGMDMPNFTIAAADYTASKAR